MKRSLKWLFLLICCCLTIPQLIIYTKHEPKIPRFMVPHRKYDHNVTIHELQDVNTSVKNNNVLAFAPPKLNIVHSKKEEGQRPQESSHINKKTKDSRLKAAFENNKKPEDKDVLPLLYLDPDCSKSYTGFFRDDQHYCLPELDLTNYFINNDIHHCFKEGTFNILKNGTECMCRNKWHGQYCSMYDVVYFSEFPRSEYAYMVSHQPRRVINAFPLTQEFALLEARLHELHDVVDLFIIVESNYTMGGHPRRRLLDVKLKSGYLQDYQHKIMYLPHGLFVKKAYNNVRFMDASVKNMIAAGLRRISNLKLNDILVLNEVDEIPKRESIMFLKYHYGYPEPVGFHLIPNTYGFYWKSSNISVQTYGACSIAMLFHLFNWEPYRLTYAPDQIVANRDALDHFKYKHSGAVKLWSFGTKDLTQPSGWRCSWCLKPGEMKAKLEGMHWSFLSKWKAFPALISEPRIKYNVAKGVWIDGKTQLISVKNAKSPWYAPDYLRNNSAIYNHLLIKPEY